MNSSDLMGEIRAISLFDNRYGDLRIAELERPKLVADAMQVFLLSDSSMQARAVLHCSPPLDPDAVLHSVQHAREVRSMLNARASAFVLDVLTQGRVAGLSYSVSPFCTSLSNKRPLGWIQRALLKQRICDWLCEVVRSTVSDVPPDGLATSFTQPLAYLAALDGVGDGLRRSAEHALGRIVSGAWKPKYVLMHGDLWKGNVMIRPQAHSLEWWPERAVIIDWASAQVHGHAIYDLIRIAESMRISSATVRRELQKHCDLLQCELQDARSYLIAALAYLVAHLGCFQLERYLGLVAFCVSTIDKALGPPPK